MIVRILKNRLDSLPKSCLILGPRQVGKSTLCCSLQPDIELNLANEVTFSQHLKDPGLLSRIIAAQPKRPLIILIDEIQRIPSLLNTTQALIDADKGLRFLLK